MENERQCFRHKNGLPFLAVAHHSTSTRHGTFILRQLQGSQGVGEDLSGLNLSWAHWIQEMQRTTYPRRILGKRKIRILIQGVEWPFQLFGFRRGAKCCMGTPRGNDFLFGPPLGAGGDPQRLSQSGQWGWRAGCADRCSTNGMTKPV